MMENKQQFGLIGKKLDHSFSPSYFSTKFENNLLYKNYSYNLLPFDNPKDLKEFLSNEIPFTGLNVTIPYKETILSFLDQITPIAKKIGAVNTILNTGKELIGYNTDFHGFLSPLLPFINSHKKALILGTGGASKAVQYALESQEISCTFVSRQPKDSSSLSYQELTPQEIIEHTLVINTTPIGTYPNISSYPEIPYQALTSHHLLYDLTYNPTETIFLNKGREQNCQVINGLPMLHIQAEKSWNIWKRYIKEKVIHKQNNIVK